MALQERFGYGIGTVLGVQAKPITGITDIEITGVLVRQTNLLPERLAIVTFDVDGESFQLELAFIDDTLDSNTITGRIKNRASDV